MSYGFNWAPPTAIVDLLGAKTTVAMLQKLKLKVPAVVEQAGSRDYIPWRMITSVINRSAR